MRLRALKIFYFGTLFVIVVRLFYWQIVKFDDLSVMAEQQHLSNSIIEAPRGTVYALDGSVLVSNKPTYLLYGTPKVIKDKGTLAQKLAEILVPLQTGPAPIDNFTQMVKALKGNLLEKLSQDLFWVPLYSSIDLDIKKKIEDLSLDGIGFEGHSTRFYPEASSAAHLLGFVGSDSFGKQAGYFGIEGYYNGELKGVNGSVTQEKDAGGLPIVLGTFNKRDPRNGHDLILNIDRTVQYIAEKYLKEGMDKYGARSGSVVIMEPFTGAIMAMASFPNYDPGSYLSFHKDYYKNPIVAESYEPGSTFKVLIMAGAINEKLVTPDTQCDICAGPVEASGSLIRTWNNRYFPNTTMTDVIVHSDNTGMVFTARKLGLDKMYSYLENFGFGNLTYVDLQDETSPDIRPKSDWREIDLATSSFGQGIAVTPIQMIGAVSAIANGGNLMEPHVVHSIVSDDKIIEIKPKVVRSIITPNTAATVTQMMVDAVDKGEARVFSVKGFKIAGKTGTAQIPIAGHYDPTKTVASFVGFVPADKPKFAMLVKYDEPSSSIYGAETAAPTFFAITHDLLTYFNIVPEN